uniref:Secreted protein n=1 Tax=Ixodes ricinus TaxID=34613 RepID=A0A6B0V722_IXORI
MSNPLIFFTQLLIAQAAFACPLSRQHDPADRSVTVPLSSLKTTQGNVSGTTFHADSEDDSRNKRLVFDESTRSASTSTVAYEATKGLSERFAIRGQGSTHVCTMSNPLIFFTQVSNCHSLHCKRSSNTFLFLLPCPRMCLTLFIECICVTRDLLLSGDIESNPGPDGCQEGSNPTMEEMVKAILDTQNVIMRDLSQIKNNQKQFEDKFEGLTKKVNQIEATVQEMKEQKVQIVSIEKHVKAIDDSLKECQKKNRRLRRSEPPQKSDGFWSSGSSRGDR